MLEDWVLDYCENRIILAELQDYFETLNVKTFENDYYRLELWSTVSIILSAKIIIDDGFVRAKIRGAWHFYQWRLCNKIELNKICEF